MTLRWDDRCKVTATAPGTGAIPAASPAAAGGFIQISAITGIVNSDIVPYTITDGATLFENGYGTWNSVTGLTRTTVKTNSSRNTSAINFTGAVTVFCGAIAASLPLLDASGNLSLPGALSSPTFTGTMVLPFANGGISSTGIGTTGASPVPFMVNGTERARFGTDGSLLINGTTNGGWSNIAKFDSTCTADSQAGVSANCGNFNSIPFLGRTGTFGVLCEWHSGVTNVGTITSNGTGTTYGSASDARLKQNIADAPDAGTIIDALRVRSWDWKSNGSHEQFGFVAQEEVLVAPFAVVEGDNNQDAIEKQWSRDDAKLVPLLVKEIQSLRARLAALEAKG